MKRHLARVFTVLLCSTSLVAAAQTASSSVPPQVAGAAKTQLTWYGHAAFKLVTPSGKVLLLDPWITNPLNPNGKQDLADLKKVDLILISHGHADHVGDSVEIAKRTKARLVTAFDQAQAYARHLGFPSDQFGVDSVGNVGGTLSFFDGEVKITLVNAIHGSTLTAKEKGGDVPYAAGNPLGFVIAVRNGPTIYHTGDTDAFTDMQLLRSMKITLMLACIGDHFTMGPDRAAEAVALAQPAKVAPMHYGTFPVLTGTPAQFAAALKAKDLLSRYQPLQLRETLDF
ncbi:MAG TPA: metal-dependent hydrolase [Myxococcaceae bacterium]|nr:metal-dependent hydrolase [Myxococcaceae bacterium]